MSGVADYRIRIYGAACLRRPAEPAVAGSSRDNDVLDHMWSHLEQDGGVGLAAPQVGVSRQLIVIRDPESKDAGQRLDLVNPVLKTTFGEQIPFEEGCLSFPGIYFEVQRPRGVVIEFQDRNGRECRISDEGLLARIIQHEVDHLAGVLFIDRISFWRRLMLRPRLIWCRLTGGGGS